MKNSLLMVICAALVCVFAASCSNKQKSQYVGDWTLSDISLDGKHWDKSLMPEDNMTIAINGDGTLNMSIGDVREDARWYIDDNGNIVMGEQIASIDDEGYLVADHNGTIVRMAKK